MGKKLKTKFMKMLFGLRESIKKQKYFDGAEKVNDSRALREADPSFFEKSKTAHSAPQQRYSYSVTANQEYGWDNTPLMKRYENESQPTYPFDPIHRTKVITEITRNGFIKR